VVLVFRIGSVPVLLIAMVTLSFLMAPAACASHGSSRTELNAGEYKVLWFNAETAAEEVHTLYWTAEDPPITIWIVAQDEYNLTVGGEPVSYIARLTGISGEHALPGPLPLLFYVVLSPSSQWFMSESWTESPLEKGLRVFLPPIGSITLVLLLIVGAYWVTQRKRQPSGTASDR
jgi:hypothetical protein